MGELEEHVAELKGRVRRLDAAMAELERFARGTGGASQSLGEAVRDFERDLGFLQRTFARVKDASSRPPTAS